MEINVARVRLIRELRDDSSFDEAAALPVVLLLLDQLHDLRRRMHELGSAIERTVPGEIRQPLMLHLSKNDPSTTLSSFRPYAVPPATR